MPYRGHFLGNAFGRSLFICMMLAGFSSCASVSGPALQPQINGLIVANRIKLAADKIMAQEADYGAGNYVLYHLDRGLVLALNGDITGSLRSLEKAKARDEELYTRSLTQEATTWLVNDNRSPYRSPAYERVLMNVFQAFNYLKKGDLNEALVEARDLDSRFPVVNDTPDGEQKHLEDNGFARLLTGILYEAAGTGSNLNDALIAYKQSLAVYDAYYGKQYVPDILQQGLLRLSRKFNDQDLGEYRSRFNRFHADEGSATVYLLESIGFSPVKVPQIIPVPVDRGFVTKIAFPRFMPRIYGTRSSRLVLQNDQGTLLQASTELGLDIEQIADKDLESRKVAILSKSVLRPALKYLVERNQKDVIEKNHGRFAAEVFGFVSNLYNIYTEQADLRSWQALPAQIRVARMAVDPGVYHAIVDDFDGGGVSLASEDMGQIELKAGASYFIIHRSVR